jgi:uroporphyrinogen decarboxylase
MALMNSRERVLAALNLEQPDRVPFGEMGIDRPFATRLMNWEAGTARGTRDTDPYTAGQLKSIARKLNLDTVFYYFRPPIYAEQEIDPNGYVHYGEGHILSEDDLGKISLPDPYDDSFYEDAATFAAEKEDYAALLVCRAGLYPTMASLGFENFCLSLYMNPEFVEKVLDLYFDWAAAVSERASGIGFDVFVTTDDFASKNGLLFDPQVFRDMMIPRYRRIMDKLDIPWVMHSDGNIMDQIEDLIELGIAGLHPFEKDAIDIREVKRRYGRQICLWGNVDVNMLSLGGPDDIEKEVRGLIEDLAEGGGYILTSGNSITTYCKTENILRMSQAVQKYGSYSMSLNK